MCLLFAGTSRAQAGGEQTAELLCNAYRVRQTRTHRGLMSAAICVGDARVVSLAVCVQCGPHTCCRAYAPRRAATCATTRAGAAREHRLPARCGRFVSACGGSAAGRFRRSVSSPVHARWPRGRARHAGAGPPRGQPPLPLPRRRELLHPTRTTRPRGPRTAQITQRDPPATSDRGRRPPHMSAMSSSCLTCGLSSPGTASCRLRISRAFESMSACRSSA